MKDRRYMREPIRYLLDHARGTVDLRLTSERLVVKTQGRGLIDRPRTLDIPLSDVKYFALVPTIGIQNVLSRRNPDNWGYLYDHSYESEFMFSYYQLGKVKKKRVFVDSEDAAFQHFLAALISARPDASLMHLEPRAAYKQIGLMRPINLVYIVVGLLVGVPVILTLGMVTYFFLTGFK